MRILRWFAVSLACLVGCHGAERRVVSLERREAPALQRTYVTPLSTWPVLRDRTAFRPEDIRLYESERVVFRNGVWRSLPERMPYPIVASGTNHARSVYVDSAGNVASALDTNELVAEQPVGDVPIHSGLVQSADDRVVLLDRDALRVWRGSDAPYEIALPPGSPVVDVAWFDSEQLLLLRSDGKLYESSDAGMHWSLSRHNNDASLALEPDEGGGVLVRRLESWCQLRSLGARDCTPHDPPAQATPDAGHAPSQPRVDLVDLASWVLDANGNGVRVSLQSNELGVWKLRSDRNTGEAFARVWLAPRQSNWFYFVSGNRVWRKREVNLFAMYPDLARGRRFDWDRETAYWLEYQSEIDQAFHSLDTEALPFDSVFVLPGTPSRIAASHVRVGLGPSYLEDRLRLYTLHDDDRVDETRISLTPEIHADADSRALWSPLRGSEPSWDGSLVTPIGSLATASDGTQYAATTNANALGGVSILEAGQHLVSRPLPQGTLRVGMLDHNRGLALGCTTNDIFVTSNSGRSWSAATRTDAMPAFLLPSGVSLCSSKLCVYVGGPTLGTQCPNAPVVPVAIGEETVPTFALAIVPSSFVAQRVTPELVWKCDPPTTTPRAMPSAMLTSLLERETAYRDFYDALSQSGMVYNRSFHLLDFLSGPNKPTTLIFVNDTTDVRALQRLVAVWTDTNHHRRHADYVWQTGDVVPAMYLGRNGVLVAHTDSYLQFQPLTQPGEPAENLPGRGFLHTPCQATPSDPVLELVIRSRNVLHHVPKHREIAARRTRESFERVPQIRIEHWRVTPNGLCFDAAFSAESVWGNNHWSGGHSVERISTNQVRVTTPSERLRLQSICTLQHP